MRGRQRTQKLGKTVAGRAGSSMSVVWSESGGTRWPSVLGNSGVVIGILGVSIYTMCGGVPLVLYHKRLAVYRTKESETTTMADVVKTDITHVEHIEEGGAAATKGKVMGTVKLTEGKIVYIPTPTADPRGKKFTLALQLLCLRANRIDPLNMAIWQKWVVLVVISICESYAFEPTASN